MDRGGMASSLPRLFLIRALPVLAALALLGATLPATAQTVVGGGSRPSVTVDWSVLDSLGPAPTLPDLLRGKTPQQRRAAATAPSSTAKSTLHSPKKRAAAAKPAKTKTKRVPPELAAKPAAPVAPVAATGNAAASDKTPGAPREKVTSAPLPEAATAPATAPASAAAEKPAPPAQAAATPAPLPQATATAAPPPAPPAPAAPPQAAPPTPVPELPPSPTAVAAINTPPSVAPSAPVTATPVTPVAAPAAVAAAGSNTRILFPPGTADLPEEAKAKLDALVRQLNGNERERLQLVAYASGSESEANQARRISLQRALAVRTYLMERGIANTRMDVRALGNRSQAPDPPDRVDLVTLDR
jgi:outer membrane protein OmpA-like peptidoglycan-associated protein